MPAFHLWMECANLFIFSNCTIKGSLSFARILKKTTVIITKKGQDLSKSNSSHEIQWHILITSYYFYWLHSEVLNKYWDLTMFPAIKKVSLTETLDGIISYTTTHCSRSSNLATFTGTINHRKIKKKDRKHSNVKTKFIEFWTELLWCFL